jgi:glycosyltransferase involved in cell wall biosynthesis
MRKVIFVVSPLHKTQFSGGLIAVFRYAEGLKRLGWDVSMVPIGSSPTTGWFDRFGDLKINTLNTKDLFKVLARTVVPLCAGILNFLVFRSGESKKSLMSCINSTAVVFLNIFHRYLPYEAKRSTWIFNIRRQIDYQATLIATTYETAYALQAAGVKDYLWFMMHDERLFVADFKGHKSVADLDVEISVLRSKHIVVNSSWLKDRMLNEFPEKKAWLCLNALEDEFKIGSERRRSDLKHLSILSYSGRSASWKGFAEMNEGVKLAVLRRPDIKFNWRIYGPLPSIGEQTVSDCCTNLGFISDLQLISEYLQADVLLSASWYESFPLFPLEGMGLGAAVIATMPGCEDYLKHEENGLVISPRSPSEICDALIRLADDEGLRLSLINAGFKTARTFEWTSSCANLHRILDEFNVISGITTES